MTLKPSVQRHVELLKELAKDEPFTVFLCGPTLREDSPNPAAQLRGKLIAELEANGFEVVLGEDDGLENQRLDFGLNAQDNELEFAKGQCNAIIIIADSVGSFCEFGLFSWHYVHENGHLNKSPKPAFIVLVGHQHETGASYFNEGPVRSLLGFGHTYYIDFESYEVQEITKILANKRSIQILDKRGRPRGE